MNLIDKREELKFKITKMVAGLCALKPKKAQRYC